MKYRKLLDILGICFLCVDAYAAAPTTPPPATPSVPSAQTVVQEPQVQNYMMGNAFLMSNKTRPGVMTLADGMQYKIIKQGSGPSPTENDIVTVDYVGTLVDGTQFDSSYQRHQPAQFPVSGVIAGWQEALKLMKVGSTWEIYIPPQLAYGKEGMPPVIGPNQTLIFRVHLLGIKK